MSGLIWAGLGKGIADAGATYGNAMFRIAESELADQRALQKAEAMERLRGRLDEERAQRDADTFGKAQVRATEIASERDAKQTQADVGSISKVAGSMKGDSPVASDEEIKKHIESLAPGERQALEGSGLIGAKMSGTRRELQGYEDTITAARELGGSSSMIKSLQDAKRVRLEEIRAENAERKADADREAANRRLDQQDRRLDQIDERNAGTLRIAQQNADANTARAGAAVTNAGRSGGRSGGGSGDKPITGVDLERSAKAAEKALALELGVPVKDLQSEVARLRKRNALTPEAQAKLQNYNSALTRWENYKSDAKPSKGGDNGNVKQRDYRNLWN